MSEELPPINPESGNPLEGSSGGSVGVDSEGSVGDHQSQLAALEKRRADFQSLSDKQALRIQSLETEKNMELETIQQQIADMNTKLQGLGNAPSVDDIAARVTASMASYQALAGYKASLAEKYKGVDVGSLVGKTPEELEGQAKAKFEEREAVRTALRAEAQTEVRAQYEAKYGKLSEANGDPMDQGDKGDADGGTVTVERFMSMTPAEESALDEETWKKMMNEVSALTGDE